MKARTLFAGLLLGLLLAAVATATNSVELITKSVTTDAAGDVTTTTSTVSGYVAYIRYAGGFDATADFTITCTRTGEGYWTESNVAAAKIVYPTAVYNNQIGGSRTQPVEILCPSSSLTITVAQGGNAKSAVFEIAVRRR